MPTVTYGHHGAKIKKKKKGALRPRSASTLEARERHGQGRPGGEGYLFKEKQQRLKRSKSLERPRQGGQRASSKRRGQRSPAPSRSPVPGMGVATAPKPKRARTTGGTQPADLSWGVPQRKRLTLGGGSMGRLEDAPGRQRTRSRGAPSLVRTMVPGEKEGARRAAMALSERFLKEV